MNNNQWPVAIIDPSDNSIIEIKDNVQEAKKWIKNKINPIWVNADQWSKAQNKNWKIVSWNQEVIWQNK